MVIIRVVPINELAMSQEFNISYQQCYKINIVNEEVVASQFAPVQIIL